MSKILQLLLIDDDELDRISIARALSKSPLRVEITEASTAADGLRKACSQTFDAILLDYNLPDQSGLDVLTLLRADTGRHSAIIMISRLEDEALAEQCIEAGAQDFLLKDEVNGRRLSRAIRQAKQRHSMEEALYDNYEHLRRMVGRDRLTGLASRYSFELSLQQAIARAQRNQTPLALLLLDLDHFKRINDSMGYAAGDEVLKHLAQRLALTTRKSDTLARLGDDKFVILAQSLGHTAQANLLVARALAALQTPIIINSVELVVTASMGVVAFLGDAQSAEDLIRCAEIAVQTAKKDGSNRASFYSEAQQQAIEQHANSVPELKTALAQQQLVLYYQAQVSAENEEIVGMEALLRWKHPQRGLLTPDKFMVVAEDTGLIIPIGEWVLRTACLQLKAWKQRFVSPELRLTVAVNLSAIQILNENLLSTVSQILSESQLEPDCLELEITESALIADPEYVVFILEQLVALGVTLSLDDFGTGYSSLQHLKLFPVRVLKVDKGFVSTIGQSKHSERLLAAIIHFARALDLTVVAEGVETREHANFCRDKGCNILQGYYFARPMPAEDFAAKFLNLLPDSPLDDGAASLVPPKPDTKQPK